jgi:ketosteroid isomerase-like protein
MKSEMLDAVDRTKLVSPEAFVAISGLVSEYCLAYDAGDFKRFASIWTDDARFSAEPAGPLPVPMYGRAAIVDTLAARRSAGTGRRTRHYTLNLRLEPRHDGAVTGLSAMLVVEINAHDGSMSIHRTGWYHDVFALERGQWRLQERLLVYDVLDHGNAKVGA